MLTERLNILISPEQKETWFKYAEQKKISVGELIRISVDKEIEKWLKDELKNQD